MLLFLCIATLLHIIVCRGETAPARLRPGRGVQEGVGGAGWADGEPPDGGGPQGRNTCHNPGFLGFSFKKVNGF